jgi:hypothetical protein
MVALAVLVGVIVAIVAAVSGSGDATARRGSASGASGRPLPYAEDVAVTSCGPDSGGNLEATVSVTNHGSTTANYLIMVAMQTPDGARQFANQPVSVNYLGPGQRTVRQVPAVALPTGPYVCRVNNITRIVSP